MSIDNEPFGNFPDISELGENPSANQIMEALFQRLHEERNHTMLSKKDLRKLIRKEVQKSMQSSKKRKKGKGKGKKSKKKKRQPESTTDYWRTVLRENAPQIIGIGSKMLEERLYGKERLTPSRNRLPPIRGGDDR